MGKLFRKWLSCGVLAAVCMAATISHADEVVRAKVIYGADDRIDLYQESDPDRQSWAAATCALINQSRIAGNGNGTYTIVTDDFTVSGRQPCDGEPFATQPTAAFCSGFLAGPDILVTAGHCITDNSKLATTRYVFGFTMTDANNAVTVVNADQVYSGVEIIEREYGPEDRPTGPDAEYDHTVVRLDRPVTLPGVHPLPIRRDGVVAIGANVGVIGYPTGLPLKLSFGALTVVQDTSNDGFFVANLDTYGGNSGSPVFNASTGIVEGILVRGNRDYTLESNCFRSNILPNTNSGEDVSKSLSFADVVPEIPVEGEMEFHTADTNQNGVISLSETLRGIQLYNSESFHCEAGTEDGFGPGVGDIDCAFHNADYQVPNFTLNLSELLRLIQLMHAAHYTACDEGEDGFCF